MLSTPRLTSDTTLAYTDLNSLQKINAETNNDLALQKVAKQFESMFVNLLFQGMRQSNAVFEDDNMGHSNAENMYRDMYDKQLSLTISEGRGMGIAEMVYRQLKAKESPHPVSSGEFNSSQLHGGEPLPISLRTALNSPVNAAINHSLKNSDSINTSSADPINNNEPRRNSTPLAAELPEFHSAMLTNNPPPESADFSPKSPQEFTEFLLPIAKKISKTMNFDPLMMVAQAALETGWGRHMVKDTLGSSANNLFNIKADGRWSGDSVKTQTVEFRDGLAVRESARFRRYDSIASSINDFVNFVHTNPRYDQALKLSADGHQFIDALQAAGYATDPEYANKVKAVYQMVQEHDAELQGDFKAEPKGALREELEGEFSSALFDKKIAQFQSTFTERPHVQQDVE